MISGLIIIYLMIGFLIIQQIYEKLPQIDNAIQAAIVIILWPYYLIYTILKPNKPKNNQ
jgi:hypothetical protein